MMTEEQLKKMAEITRGAASPEAYKEFYNLWTKTYEETFGKFLGMTLLGPAKEITEKFFKGFEVFTKFYKAWMNFYFKFYRPWTEAMGKMRDVTSKMMKGEITIESYKESYNAWISTYEETFDKFLRSDEFASDFGAFINSFLDFRKYYEDVSQGYLKTMSLPTKSDIDEINREIHLLKKQVRELSGQVKALS
ncbi:MAG: hypothetical protein HY929_04335 [Euryarchaeota archaeon]|nr:hypothetical protein [Euryarchaeota archaeon]